MQDPINIQSEDVVTIDQYEEDITGNGLKETIDLKGVPLTKENNFYRDIWAEITSEDGITWTIPYLSGYDPKMHFIMLPNKQEKGIFYHSKQSKEQHHEQSFLHSIVNGKLIEEELPDHLPMSGSFQDQYIVQLSTHDELDPIRLQIDQTEPYEEMYAKDGRLQKQTAVLVDQGASIEPTYISTSKQYGLKSTQEVMNADTKEVLGGIETLWYLENNRWIKLKEQWISLN